MDIRILGPLEVTDGTRVLELGGSRQRVLLARLAVAANRVVAVDALVDELWGPEAGPGAKQALQAQASRIRRALGDGSRVVARAPGYVLRLQPEELDAAHFETLLSRARAAAADGDFDAATRLWTDAETLWRGPVLEEFADYPFAQSEAARLEELRLAAIEARVEAELNLGRHGQLVAELEGLVGPHPYRERLWAHLMLALYRCGRQADALGAYQRVRKLLGEELGITPGPDLVGLEEAILLQKPELSWISPPSPVVDDNAPLPRQLARPEKAQKLTQRPLIGRAGELSRLEAALAHAIGGRPRVIQIIGNPGVGKTELARALTDRALTEGTWVVWGRCVADSGVPPYFPWTQVLRVVVETGGSGLVRHLQPPALSWLAHLEPGLIEHLGGERDIHPPSGLAPTQARFALFESVVSLLTVRARMNPGVIVLDDVHAADAASILLLSFVARALTDAGLLIVTTGRRACPELRDCSELVRLHGLSIEDVSQLYGLRMGKHPSAEELTALHSSTGGNPLFLDEVLTHKSPLSAHALREVLRDRLATFSGDVSLLLTASAILGDTFPAAVVRALSGLTPDAFTQAVDTALAAGLARESENGQTIALSHPIIREALDAGLPPNERRSWHLRAADVLGDPAWIGRRRYSGERAYHLREALPLGDPAVAVALTLEVAEDALRRMAFEDATEVVTACLKKLDWLPSDMPAERCRLLVASAIALSRAGDRASSREAARQAARLARHLQSTQLFASVALAMPREENFLLPDPELKGLLQEVLRLSGQEDSPQQVRLLARLAQEFPTEPREELRKVADTAAALTVRLEDPILIALAHKTRQHALWFPEGAEERLPIATAMIAITKGRDVELELDGHMWRMIALLEVGRVGEATLEVVAYQQLAERIGDPWFLTFARSRQAMVALLRGRFDEAERLAAEARDLAKACGSPEADALYVGQLADLRAERGDNEAMTTFVDQGRGAWLHPFGVATFLTMLGRMHEARAELRQGLEQESEQRQAFNRLLVLASGARAAYALGDRYAASRLYEELAPYQHLHVVIAGGIVYSGPVSRYLGLCAAASGRMDVARSHLEEAVAVTKEAEALPLVARTSLELAQVLESLAQSCDEARVISLRTHALTLGQSLGMPLLASEAELLLSTG